MTDALPPFDRDAEHLRLLAIFHYVYGGLKIAFSSLFILHAVMGFALYANPQLFNPPVVVPLPQPLEARPKAEPKNAELDRVDARGDDVEERAMPMFPGNFPREMFLAFAIFAAALVVGGWTLGILTIVSGRSIARRRRRVFSIVVAAINCVFMPFGTALGVCTLMVLVRPTTQALYASN